MIDVKRILEEISHKKINKETDLVDDGILDSLGMIIFLSKLENEGIEISFTRVNKDVLRHIDTLQKHIDEVVGGRNQ